MYAAARQHGRVPTGQLAALSAQAGLPFVPVLVKNATGGAIARLGTAVLDGSAIDPDAALAQFKVEWRLKLKTPTDDGVGRPLVLLDQVDDGGLADAVLLGLAVVQVDIQDAGDTVCGPASGDVAKLKSGVGSIELLDRESGTGVKWCLVLIGGGGGSAPPAVFGTGMITADVDAAVYSDATNSLNSAAVELRKFRTGGVSGALQYFEEPIEAYSAIDEPITVDSGKGRLCHWWLDEFGDVRVAPSCLQWDFDQSNPSITTSATQTAPENSTATIVTLAGTDIDDDAVWSISGGADASRFAINESSGALSFAAAQDYEDPGDANADGDYVVQIKVLNEDGETATKTLTITLTDVAE